MDSSFEVNPIDFRVKSTKGLGTPRSTLVLLSLYIYKRERERERGYGELRSKDLVLLHAHISVFKDQIVDPNRSRRYPY